MPWNEIIAGLLLTGLVALAVELAEVSFRVAALPLRYGDRLDATPRESLTERLGGLAISVIAIWFLALPWVAEAAAPASALALFLAMLVVGVMLLHRVQHAILRYPAATAAPLIAVAFATAMT